jgi:methionyl-tRNA formyltransferase
LVREIAIAGDETSASLHDRLAKLGAESIVEALSTIAQGAALIKTSQAAEGIRYAEKILKSEAEIDWQLSAREVDRRIRAFNPFPGATSNLDDIPIKFWNSRVLSVSGDTQSGQPGEVLGFSKEGVFIQCGQGTIEVLEMQKPGGKRMNAIAYLRTHGAPSKALCFHKE